MGRQDVGDWLVAWWSHSAIERELSTGGETTAHAYWWNHELMQKSLDNLLDALDTYIDERIAASAPRPGEGSDSTK